MSYILITVIITVINLKLMKLLIHFFIIRRGILVAALKYSRQREAIKHYLASTKEHPTADTVYMHVKRNFPISVLALYIETWICLQTSVRRSRYQHLTEETDLMEPYSRTIISYVRNVDGSWILSWIWKVLKRWTVLRMTVLTEWSLPVLLYFMENAVTALESLNL